MSRTRIFFMVLSRLVGGAIFFLLIFLLPAGTWTYWQAWLYIGVLFTPMLFVLAYFIRRDPELLVRRMRMREQRTTQRKIIQFSGLFLTLAYLLPGFDIRYGWSRMPAWVSLLSAAVMFLGYALVVRTMQVNRFLSRVIEVDKDQQVVDTDVYSLVRHPMYVGMIVLFMATPLVLGSYWAVLPALAVFPVIVARIMDEEKALEQDLPGYRAYQQKVRYRLIPFVW